MRTVSDEFRGNENKILCSTSFFFENVAVYEIMWKNIVAWGRPQTTTWSILVA